MQSRFNNLVICITGKKESGKNTLAKGLSAYWMNIQEGRQRFYLNRKGKLISVVDSDQNKEIEIETPCSESQSWWDKYNVKFYSFADDLKRICMNQFGLDIEQCYGSNDDKNTKTHIHWENMPEEVRQAWSRPRRGSGGIKPASGYLTARELLQVVGSDIFRKIDPNCWARSTYYKIGREKYGLSLITDGRFPCEVTMGTESDAKSLRLTRDIHNQDHISETALDNMAWGEFDLVVDNSNLSISECHDKVYPSFHKWMIEKGLINHEGKVLK